MQKPEDDGGPVLTRREVEVLGLIAEGMTNQEMAEKLFVSSSTVITHRKNLMAKIGAKNTAINKNGCAEEVNLIVCQRQTIKLMSGVYNGRLYMMFFRRLHHT